MANDTTYSTLAGYVAAGICFAGDDALASMSRIILNKNNAVVIDTDTNGALRFPQGGGVTYSGPLNITVPVGAYVDNAITVRNASGGFNSIAFFNTAGEVAFGIGPDGSGASDFFGCYLSTVDNSAATDAPPDIAISQQEGPAANQHRRIFIDGTAHTVACYGWLAAVGGEDTRIGPGGWIVQASGLFTINGGLSGSAQALTGAGAVNLTTTTTKLTTTGGAQALTLANGTDAQIKTIIHDVDGGSAVLTPTTANGFTTITFTNAGETATLQYTATRGWVILALRGAVAA